VYRADALRVTPLSYGSRTSTRTESAEEGLGISQAGTAPLIFIDYALDEPKVRFEMFAERQRSHRRCASAHQGRSPFTRPGNRDQAKMNVEALCKRFKGDARPHGESIASLVGHDGRQEQQLLASHSPMFASRTLAPPQRRAVITQ
jgi:hypothetical protein